MWKDENGIDTIPLKLVVYLALVGIIIALAAIGLKNAGPPMDGALMERQLGEVKSGIELMQSGYARDLSDPYTATGNTRSFDLVLPERLEYLSFGADPDPDNNGILTDTPPGLVTDNGDVIYYKLRGDGKRLVKLKDSIHIREGELVDGRWSPSVVDGLGQAFVLTGGSQSVTFELVYDRGTTYTLSHLSDNLDVYINPDNDGGLPHGLFVSVNPDSFPADDVTEGSVTVQLVDSQGRWVQEMGRTVNLTSSRGNLSAAQVVTNAHGSGSVMLTSGELGLGVVTAQSPGLHNGTSEVAFTPPPLVIEFNEWINSSKKTDPDSELAARFWIEHNTSYSVTLTGWATEAHWLTRPEEWAIGKIEIDGVVLDEIEVAGGSRIDVPFGDVLLSEGKHTLRVTMTNDLNILWGEDRNLYVEQVEFS
ncbi:MAG: hypothetical protein HF976_15530 [ANME-2 cluster archaeon]|nr:hypothetical protein [ANME-2 cluster archaeon]MBC2702788.1 hypothetical protein [ANME-2 cluster archaeon]MBC2706332.1 hypothetical protein [ANME-2 cluster archaeon]MBC2747114.1 hypothetical protein [ANME-2 cluster archaeon]MBC2762104.1 hypothetical protein [ANME-2 cluster archaeon]